VFVALAPTAFGGENAGQWSGGLMTHLKTSQDHFTVSRHAVLSRPVINVYLYNPTLDEFPMKYPHKDDVVTMKMLPTLVMSGNGLPEGPFSLICRIEKKKGVVEHAGSIEVKVEVRSQEKLDGEEIVDFDQGSVGFYRPESPRVEPTRRRDTELLLGDN